MINAYNSLIQTQKRNGNREILKDLFFGVYMRLMGSIQWLCNFVIGIGKNRYHSAKQIPSEKEYCRNSSPFKVLHYLLMMIH